MKKKKILLKIALVILLLTIVMMFTNTSHAFFTEIGAVGGAVGLGIILVWGAQLAALGIGTALQGIIDAISGLNGSSIEGIKSIIFNETPITTASFFTNDKNFLGLSTWSGDSIAYKIAQNVSNVYYIIRNLSIAALLFVLLYIGIRMAISTVASEEARYKKMLMNWVVSLATVFVLHYIMILTFYFNNKLVAILSEMAIDSNIMGDTLKDLALNGLVPFEGIAECIVYCMLIGTEVTFLFMYIKRVITLGFLIVIAPLITITYSIDKIKDNQAQALNTWLKEFIFTVLVQPFHCIIYIVLVQTVVNEMAGDPHLGVGIMLIVMLNFLREAENIIRTIFNVKAQGAPGFANMGPLALGIMSTIGNRFKNNKARSNKKMPDLRDEQKDKSGNTQVRMTDEQGSTGNTGSRNGSVRNGVPVVDVRSGNSNPVADGANVSGAIDAGSVPPGGNNQGRKGNFFVDAMRYPDELQQRATEAVRDTARDIHDKLDDSKLAKTLRKSRFIQGFNRGWSGTARMIAGDKGPREFIRKAVNLGATATGFGIGLGATDFSGAVGFGLTVGGAAGGIEGMIDDHRINRQLEINEDIFQDSFGEYIEGRVANGESAAQATQDAITLFENIKNGAISRSEIEDADQKALIDKAEKMEKSAEIAGVAKPEDYVRDLMDKRGAEIASSSSDRRYRPEYAHPVITEDDEEERRPEAARAVEEENPEDTSAPINFMRDKPPTDSSGSDGGDK